MELFIVRTLLAIFSALLLRYFIALAFSIYHALNLLNTLAFVLIDYILVVILCFPDNLTFSSDLATFVTFDILKLVLPLSIPLL